MIVNLDRIRLFYGVILGYRVRFLGSQRAISLSISITFFHV